MKLFLGFIVWIPVYYLLGHYIFPDFLTSQYRGGTLGVSIGYAISIAVV